MEIARRVELIAKYRPTCVLNFAQDKSTGTTVRTVLARGLQVSMRSTVASLTLPSSPSCRAELDRTKVTEEIQTQSHKGEFVLKSPVQK